MKYFSIIVIIFFVIMLLIFLESSFKVIFLCIFITWFLADVIYNILCQAYRVRHLKMLSSRFGLKFNSMNLLRISFCSPASEIDVISVTGKFVDKNIVIKDKIYTGLHIPKPLIFSFSFFLFPTIRRLTEFSIDSCPVAAFNNYKRRQIPIHKMLDLLTRWGMNQ